MSSTTQTVAGVVVACWTLLQAAGGEAAAQTATPDSIPANRLSRLDWQQRVLRRTPAGQAGAGRTSVTKYRPAPLPGRRWSAVRTASADVASQPEEIPAPAEEPLPLQKVPADEAYEPFATSGPEVIGTPPGEPMMEEAISEGYEPGFPGGWDGCGTSFGGAGAFGPGLARPMGAWWTRDMSLWVGIQGFKGPVDQGRNGNFGIHEGLNFGAPLGLFPRLGYQVGFNVVHSNLSGHQTLQELTSGTRNQFFLTAGIFRRAIHGGLQGGIAFDFLHDRYFETSELRQIRSETGYRFSGGLREIGYFGAYGSGGDDLILLDRNDLRLEPTDLFGFYYRRYFTAGGEGRIWTGFTGRGDGMVGGDIRVPIGRSWALENRFNYLIPREGAGEGQAEESWGLSIQLVWYLGPPARCVDASPFRPLFHVADNSLFMSDAHLR